MNRCRSLAPLLFVALASCSDPTSPLTNPKLINLDLRAERYRTADSIHDAVTARARFNTNDDGDNLDAGRVSIDGVELVRGADGYAPAGSSVLAIPVDGGHVRWAIGGSSAIPAFTDSVRTPIAPTRILSPRPGDTISRSRGVVLEWTPSQASDSGLAMSYVLQREGAATAVRGGGPDTGRLELDASHLAGVVTGASTLTVERTIARYGSIQGKSYVMMTTSAERIPVVVVE